MDNYVFDFRLPIPCPELYYDNYHHPLFPLILPQIHCYANPAINPYSFPLPLGVLPPHRFDILGATLHDFGYVNNHPEKLFTRFMLWYIEIKDQLFRQICPSDLNDMPCEWDELQGGCPMLRLCEMKHKYANPHLGVLSACRPEFLNQCTYIHDVQPTCRSIGKELRKPVQERFCSEQLCRETVRGGSCPFGHDFESVRAEAVYGYWEHRREARLRGSIGYVNRDVFGRKLMRPAWPIVE